MEDNPTDVFVIKEVLKRGGLTMNLHTAKDGEEALRYLQELAADPTMVCPSLILLDLNLPKIGGIDVLRQIRKNPRCSETPVMIITSSTMAQDRSAVRELGAEAYFQKPNDLKAYSELAALVKSLLTPGA